MFQSMGKFIVPSDWDVLFVYVPDLYAQRLLIKPVHRTYDTRAGIPVF